MTSLWMFPGQGSQSPGMARQLLAEFPLCRDIFSEASDVSGFDLMQLSQRGPVSELARPSVAEPLLAATQIGYASVLKSAGIQPDFVAGYSAGEVAALFSCGVLSRTGALQAATIRGRILNNYCSSETRMISVTRIRTETMQRLLSNLDSTVEVAADNAPDGMTLVGDRLETNSVATELVHCGASIAEVAVSGPWHSRRILPAAQEIYEALAVVDFSIPQTPVFLSATGQTETAPNRLRHRLADQVAMPVLWQQTLSNVWARGTREVLELGAGRVLSGFLRRNWLQFNSYSVTCVEPRSGNIAPLKRLLTPSLERN